MPDMMMPIVAYDLTAVPGRRYQYRTRYEVLNQYANNAGELVDPKGASTSTLFSAWSPPSREVQIEGATQFFLTDANAGQNKVEVTVWKKSRRNWEKKSFRLAVGDTIGGNDKDFGTGAVIVDIRFNERVNGKPDTVLVYVAPDGSLREALLSVDKERDKRLNA